MTTDSILDHATALQRQAADPGFSAWVSANAGAGKTRVLIDRISRLLLAGVPAQKILCLTFTKAAAAEMENRLSKRLGEWAMMDDAKLTEALFELLGTSPDAADLVRARRLYAETLEAPGGLSIRTIHAFCESLLGRFPVEAGVAPHTSVMDERTANQILAEAREHVYAAAARAPGSTVSAALDHLAGQIDESTFSDIVRAMLSKRSRLSRALHLSGGLPGLIAAIASALGIDPEATESSLLHESSAENAFDRKALEHARDALLTGTKSDVERADTLSDWLESDEARRMALLASTYRSLFLRQDGEPKVQRSMITGKPSEAYPAAADALFAEQDRIRAFDQQLKAVAVLSGTRSLLILAASLVEEYERRKKARAELDYDDLILKALELLRKDGGIGWVHYKLDGGIDHVLVDEAQDTSPEQWEIIERLTDEFFTGEGAHEPLDTPVQESERPLPRRTVFAVGDKKQSIYSFQGADPEGFERVGSQFETRAREAGTPFRPVILEQSFRSTSAVLDLVDAVFSREPAQPGVSDEHGTHHIANRHNEAGLARLLPAFAQEKRTDPAPWDAPVDRVRETSPMARTAESVVAMIDGWITNGEWLESRGRPVEPGDIMILLRKRGQVADDMIKRLKARGIPVAGSDRMVLTDQIAVMDLIAVAQFVLLPEDDLTLATVLKGPFVSFSDEDLFPIAHDREDASLWQALMLHAANGNGEAQRAQEVLSRWLARADYAPPYEFFSALLDGERGRSALVGRLGEEAIDPVDEFLAQAFAYERQHAPSLEGFLAWIGAASTEIKRDMETGHGQVRVMTVHGSKGLEANIVILPDTCAEPDSRMGDKILWSETEDAADPPLPFWPGIRTNEVGVCAELRTGQKEKELREYRRLLYVAMTRARDRLYLAGWERKKPGQSREHGRDENSWYELVHPALMDMDGVTIQTTPDGDLLSRNTLQTVEPKAEEAAATPLKPVEETPDWLQRPTAQEPEPSTPLSPSRPDGEEPPAMPPFAGDDTSRFLRGNLIHRMLQSLPELQVERRQEAAITWLATSASDMDQADREAIARETLAVLEAPEFVDIFGVGSLPEVPIAGTVDTPDGPRTISGQVDRLLITDDAVTIVDYKTNRPPPTDPGQVPVTYLRQMALYKSALGHIYPDRNIRCLLVWTDGPFGMALDNVELERYSP